MRSRATAWRCATAWCTGTARQSHSHCDSAPEATCNPREASVQRRGVTVTPVNLVSQVFAMIRNPLRAFIATAALLFAGGAFAAPLPAFTAHYQLSKDGSPIGEATLTLAPSRDGAWTFTTDSKGTSGLAAMLGINARETSSFRWKGDMPEGLSYDYSMDAAFKHKQRNVRFDWSGNTIVVNDKGEHRFSAQPGAIERHTVVLALAAGLDRKSTRLNSSHMSISYA